MPPAVRVTTHLALSFIEFKKTRTLLSVGPPSCESETIHLHLICALLAFGLLDTCRPAKPCQRAGELLCWHSRMLPDKPQTCVGTQLLPSTPQRLLLDRTAVDIHQLPTQQVKSQRISHLRNPSEIESTLDHSEQCTCLQEGVVSGMSTNSSLRHIRQAVPCLVSRRQRRVPGNSLQQSFHIAQCIECGLHHHCRLSNDYSHNDSLSSSIKDVPNLAGLVACKMAETPLLQ